MKLNAFSLLYVALTINLFSSIWVIAKLREQDNDIQQISDTIDAMIAKPHASLKKHYRRWS